MPTRDIKESCRTSLTLAQISHGAERLFWRLTTYADDFGRMPADAGVLRGQCFSAMLDAVRESDVSEWLVELEAADLLRLYKTNDGKTFAFFPTWRKHQRVRAKHSKYPSPSSADICRQMPTNAPEVPSSAVDTEVPPKNPKNPKTPEPPKHLPGPVVPGILTAPAWEGYRAAYQRRYGTDPVRNAKVNGQLAHLLKRIPADEAPEVAAFYVGHSAALYVRAGHPVDLLLRDAEKLRTEWVTGHRITETKARQDDQRQNTGDIAHRLLEKAERQAEEARRAQS